MPEERLLKVLEKDVSRFNGCVHTRTQLVHVKLKPMQWSMWKNAKEYREKKKKVKFFLNGL